MKKERTFFENLTRFIEPLIKNKKVTLKSIIFYSSWAIAPLFHIYFAQAIVGAIENKDKELFISTIILYIIILFSYYLFTYLIKKWGYITNIASFRRTIHNQYLEDFIHLSNTQTEKIGTGKLISIIGTGMDTWSLMLNRVLENFLKVFFALTFTIVVIGYINIYFAIIFVFLYILIHYIGSKFNDKSLYHRRKRQDTWNLYTGSIVKIIMSKFEILQTGKIKREINVVEEHNKDLLKHNLNMVVPIYWFFYIPSIFINVVKILIFIFVGYGVILGNYSMAFFVAIYGILTFMNNVIVNSMSFFMDFTNNFTKIEKLWDFFDETEDIKGYKNGKNFEYKKGDIEMKNIDFSYEKNNFIFKNFDININGGKITAFVGNSGSGKSTLVKLISGYIKADSGVISVDGQKLNEVSLKSFYKNIGYLTQEPNVFDGSILENLMYGTSNKISNKKIDEVIKLAKCEFIYDLKKGINSQIGEKGIRLSGGQRQRLAIAKIMLKDPKIIILDEPTSALDSFSEEQITKSLDNLFTGRTVIIIAHRLQTVKNADKIFVFEDGKIAEQGKHNELKKQKGIYNKMLELQSGF